MTENRQDVVSLSISKPLRKALGRNIKRVRRALAWYTIHAVAMVIPLVVVAFLASRVTSGDVDARLVWTATALIGGAVVLALVSAGLGNSLIFTGAFDMGRDLRIELVTKVRSAPVGLILGHPRGEVTSVIDRDVDDVESFINGRLADLTSALVGPVLLAIVIFTVDVTVGVGFVIAFLAVALGYRYKLRFQARHIAYRRELRATQDERVIEFIQGIEVAKAFGIRSELASRLDDSLRSYRDANLRSVRKTIPLSAGLTAAASFLIGVLLALAGWRFIDGAIDGPAFVGLSILIAGAARASLAVGGATGALPGTAASLRRINSLLDLPAAPLSPPGPVPQTHEVRFEDVTFEYESGRPVLKGLSFRAPVGQTTAIIGQSGAGKTTVLHLLAGLWTPDAGRITVGGVDLGLLSPDQREAQISIVLQDTYLPDGTVRDAITGGREVDDASIEAAARAARCWDVIESLPDGLNTSVGEGGRRLSGGERQRIAIARALVVDTPIVCLDEATAALDATTERQLEEALAALLEGRTVLVVAHRPTTIRSADQIVVLDDGRVAEVGTHDSLVGSGGIYADRVEALAKAQRGFRR